MKQTLISPDLDFQKSRCRLKGRVKGQSMYNTHRVIPYDQNMTSIFHNDLILLNGFVLQIVYVHCKKNYECSIFSSEGFLRKPLIGSCCDRAAAQKQPSLAQLATGGAAATQARAGLGDGCWSSNSSPLPSCSFFPPYSHPTPNLVLGF